MFSTKYMLVLNRNTTRSIFQVKSFDYSTIPVTKQNEKSKFEKYMHEGLAEITPKKRTKLPQRAPFAKNIFVGIFDTELLTYPQLQKDDVDELETVTDILQKMSNEEVPLNFKEVLEKLKYQKCLGLQCSTDIGGRELNASEQCRYNEVLLEHKFKYNHVNNELSILALTKYGTVEQKNRYLDKLLDGSISATVCLGDNNSGNADSSYKTVLHRSRDRKTYTLNGKKNFVIGGSDADLFIVFSQMASSVQGSLHEMDLTAVLVESNFPGISIEKVNSDNENLAGMSNITFKETLIPVENILGAEREGRHLLASGILSEYHLNYSVLNMNILKKLSKYLTLDALEKSNPNENIYEIESTCANLGEVMKSAYVVESMVYFTAGLMSTYENQDCDLEILITRIFSSELVMQSIQHGFSICGAPSLEHNHFCQKLNDDAITHFISYENHDALKILVALMGLQHSGRGIVDTVKKLRNPFFHGSFVLKKLWSDRKQNYDEPDLNIGLKNYLHPSCQDAADIIEYCVLRLKYATESYFVRHGAEVLNQHCDMKRLANCIFQIYAMTACLSRASRSYCIGLQNAELEMFVAQVFCQNAKEIVKKNIDELLCDDIMPDKSWKIAAEKLFKKKDYNVAHPLSRNF